MTRQKTCPRSAIKILLCVPPAYDRVFPPLGTPALAAFLKARGFETCQADLNIAYRDFLVSRVKTSPDMGEKKEALLEMLSRDFWTKKLKTRYYSGFLPRGSDGVCPSLPYGDNTNGSFYFSERILSSPHALRYLSDERENTFLQFFLENRILERLKKDGVGLLGLSITSPSQSVAALTLGLLVKKNLPHIHVAIGGQWATLFRRELRQKKWFPLCADSLIAFEGETPLLNLARELSAGKTPSGKAAPAEDMDSLACPDFDGLPLKKYTGSPGLPYETSRGCYWGKCAYCVDLPLPKTPYREKNPELVAKDLAALAKKYGANHFMMSDPGMSPKQMLGVSRAILKRKLKITWWTMARLDEGFDRRLFETAYASGLRQINFGFESASDEVCDFVCKGNRKERSLRVIKDCASAGIRAGLQTMLGLPGESFAQALETVDFLAANKKIAEAIFNVYYLTPANFVYLNPEKYGIRCKRDEKLPFRFFTPFRNLRGITPAQAAQAEKIYYAIVSKKAAESAGPRGKIRLKKNVRAVRARFSLNGETAAKTFLVNLKNGSALPVSERRLALLKKGRWPGNETPPAEFFSC